MLESITLRGLLSFGWEPLTVPLRRLNVLIGPNASGKSNLIEAFTLLSRLPGNFNRLVSARGGAREWLHKGSGGDGLAELEVELSDASWQKPLRYSVAFERQERQLGIAREVLTTRDSYPGGSPFIFATQVNGTSDFRLFIEERSPGQISGEERDPIYGRYVWQRLPLGQLSSFLSLSGQLIAPQLQGTAQALSATEVYSGWASGPESPLREPQKSGESAVVLEPDGSNLALVLARLKRDPQTWQPFLSAVSCVYEQVRDIIIDPIGSNLLELAIDEGGYRVPASRLSDGTLRWLFLSALLCDPQAPRLICLDEPELGLHPDLIHKLAELLRAASERTQIIVTTHSVELIDEFSASPEDVIVCERPFGPTVMRQLEREPLAAWLEDYKLGRAWRAGAIGGNRY